MYAVIETGGKQYRVAKDQCLKIEKLPSEVGSKIDFDKVLMINDNGSINIGNPTVSGCAVSAEVVSHGRAKKVNIIKFKRRKHYSKQMGHRQYFTEVKITDISSKATSDSSKSEKKEETNGT